MLPSIPQLVHPTPMNLFHIYPIKQPESCEIELDLHKDIILMNSGKSITQMGLFQQCISQTFMKYGLLLVLKKATKAPVGIQMGLCLPKICDKNQVQIIANQIFANISMPYIGQFVQNPQDFNPKFGPAFYITTILLILFTILVIFSTFFQKLGRKSAIIDAFNLKKNMNIFQYKEHKFNVFNGVKSFCMMWVILGHLFSVRLQNSVNALTIADRGQGLFFLLVLAAFYAVDVFFYIGGFLVAYSFLRNQMKSIIKYPLAIVHRLLRFWPSYIMAMMIYYSIMIHTGSGPLWWKLQTAGQIQNCQSMWKPIIFVDNIVDNGQQMCMGWGWYLQNDMQIFIISIPILYLYARQRKAAYILIQFLIVASLIYNFVEVQVNEYITVTHRPDFDKWDSYFPNVYIKPWTRCPPYLYGLTLGLLYMEHIDEQKNKKDTRGFFTILKAKLESSRVLKNLLQLTGLATLIFIVMIVRTLQVGHKWPQFVHSIYLTFTKLFFVIGVSMLVTPALLGIKNDFFFFLMDTKLFNFIAKISFWTYLTHYMIIEFVCYTQKVDYYYTVRDVLTLYIPVAILSMFFGFIGTLLIENPFAKLEKLLFEGKKKKDGNNKIQEKEKQHYKAPSLLNQSLSSSTTSSLVGSGSTVKSDSSITSVISSQGIN